MNFNLMLTSKIHNASFSAVFLLLTACGGGGGGDDSASMPENPPTPSVIEVAAQQVITWIPADSLDNSTAMLSATFGSLRPIDQITDIGLQFWTIQNNGDVVALSTVSSGLNNRPTITEIQSFVSLAQGEGIKVLATVMNNGNENGNNGFDWNVFRQAMLNSGHEKMAQQIIDVVKLYGLDGVDLDIEGGGVSGYNDNDRASFLLLIQELGPLLHADNKTLIINSGFNENGIAPFPSWWSEWGDDVDAIVSMGYFFNYKNSTQWSYQGLQNLAIDAGFKSSQLLIGMPTWLDRWAGDDSNSGFLHAENLTHVAHCLTEGATGLALWALHHPDSQVLPYTINTKPWSTEEPWKTVGEIKNGHTINPDLCNNDSAPEALSGVSQYRYWNTGFGNATILIPSSGRNALTSENGKITAHMRAEIQPDGYAEMSVPLDPYQFTDPLRDPSVDLSRSNSTIVRVTYSSNHPAILQLRQSGTHGGNHNQVNLPASPNIYTTLNINLPTDFLWLGTDPSTLEMSNLGKFNFAFLSHNTTAGYAEIKVRELIIENYLPSNDN